MAYQYQFDDTTVGNLSLNRVEYQFLQTAYRMLHAELEAWNKRLVEHDARPPYQAEANDLARMIAWGDEELSHPDRTQVIISGISVGSCRYAKAALGLMLSKRQQEREENARQGWTSAALQSLDDATGRIRQVFDVFDHEPSELLWEFIPRKDNRSVEWDAFVSHASEDKEDFARPLAEALRAQGLRVWFDEFELTVGDSLRRRIDHGLANSRFGIVIISPSFMKKEWPQKELDALVALEIGGTKAILPVWHKITAEEIRAHSPLLADRMATTSDKGLNRVIADIMRAIERSG
jgi:hypothetical protein